MPLSYKHYSTPRGAGWILAACWLSLSNTVCAQAGATPSGRHFDHIIVVVLENEGTREALGDSTIASLVKNGAWFANYHALAHPSLPNYLALVAGSTFGIDHDHVTAAIDAPTLADRLEQKNLTWKAYAEDYPGNCYLHSGAGKGYLTATAKPTDLYARKHVPFLAFKGIITDPKRCAQVVNANEFLRDARTGSLPSYSFYVPNVFHDGHDTSLKVSTDWLNDFVRSLRATPAMHQRTLMAITWDEGGGEENRVLTILLGDDVVPGRYAERLTHYSLLRTIEDNFGLQPVAKGDERATPFPDRIWRQ